MKAKVSLQRSAMIAEAVHFGGAEAAMETLYYYQVFSWLPDK